MIVFTSLFTHVAIYVVGRKKMLKRNEFHSIAAIRNQGEISWAFYEN